MKIAPYLFVFSTIWALVAGVVILLIPMGTSVTETAIGSEAAEINVRQLSWFESQGWWGIWILVAFATLYYGPLHFFRRGSRGLAALFAGILVFQLESFVP